MRSTADVMLITTHDSLYQIDHTLGSLQVVPLAEPSSILHLVNNYALLCCESVLKVYDALTLNEMPTQILLSS